jgi:hypothetical protein
MKKVITIIIVTLGVMSCKKDEPTPTNNTCQCRKDKEQLGAGGQWYLIQQGQLYIDACSKNGTIEQIDMMTRYKITCW